ncbi:NADH-quinone oxidoreductase subunit H [Escherichia coli]
MSVLYPLIQALVLFAVAPLLSGITRVARARLHNRRGPGVLQEYRDIFKLLGRQSVGPDASGWVFRLTPYVMVGVMLTIATALPVVTVGSPLPQLGDLITLLYLFAIARFFFAISGLDTGSPFTAIGASREAMLGVLVIALFENSMARLRLDITPRITWAGFGFAFLAFVSLLAA